MYQKQTRSASLASSGSSGSTASSMDSSVFSQYSGATDLTEDFFIDNPIPEEAERGMVLPCEFVGIEYCDMIFHPDDTDSWIEHIIDRHLGQRLPAKAVCWFCDHDTFELRGRRADPRENFKIRMWHIRDHIVGEGKTAHDMRPDFHMLDHLRKHRLIPEHRYYEVKNWFERPRVEGICPHDYVTPEQQKERERANRVINDQQAKEDRARLRQQKHLGRSHRH